MKFFSPERAALISVGQRPTLWYTPNPKAVGLASIRCRPYRAQNFIYRFVGRCPTLMSGRASPCLCQ